MRAMVMTRPSAPLELRDVPIPEAGPGQLLIRVSACGICRTDLHVVDGDLTDPELPLIPGHQIVGYVVAAGSGASNFKPGQRVGVPWLGGSCGQCIYCLEQRENLCDNAVYTGYQVNGGFAEYTVANANYCLTIPESFGGAPVSPPSSK
jgi:propanol-preferring alcohol dehydrogenase